MEFGSGRVHECFKPCNFNMRLGKESKFGNWDGYNLAGEPKSNIQTNMWVVMGAKQQACNYKLTNKSQKTSSLQSKISPELEMLEFLVHLKSGSNTLIHWSSFVATQIYLGSQYAYAKLWILTSVVVASSGLGHVARKTWLIEIAS